MKGLRIQGSLVGNRFVTYAVTPLTPPPFLPSCPSRHADLASRTMLDFAARHDVRPMVDEFPLTLEGVNAAFDAMAKGKLRFRAVLVAEE